jgi:hypothetical protein
MESIERATGVGGQGRNIFVERVEKKPDLDWVYVLPISKEAMQSGQSGELSVLV